MGEKKILILRASGCARVSGADLSRRAFTICYDRVFPVSMRPAAGTRQITREQREIIIRWRVSCKSDRGESVAPASRRAFGHVRPRSRNTIAPFHAIQLPAQRKESTLFFFVHSTFVRIARRIGPGLARASPGRAARPPRARRNTLHLEGLRGQGGEGELGEGTLALGASARGYIDYGSIPLRGHSRGLPTPIKHDSLTGSGRAAAR